MLGPFNFFQFAQSGAVAPFSTFFTGFYFPADLIQGGDVGFIWSLSEDDLVYPISFVVQTSGVNAKGNNDQATLSLGFSGDMTPLYTDSGNYGFVMSGVVPSGNIDNPIFSQVISGAVNSGNLQLFNFVNAIIGDIPIPLNDVSTFSVPFTGNVVSGNNEFFVYNFGFSGSLNKTNRDYANININMYSGSYNMGSAQISASGMDTGHINIAFIGITFNAQ